MSEKKEMERLPAGRHAAGRARKPDSEAPRTKTKATGTKTSSASARAAKSDAARHGARKCKAGKRRGAKAASAARTARPKRGEAAGIIRVSAIAALVLAILLGVLSLYRPQLNIARAHRFVASGEIVRAEDMLNYMIRREYPEADIANLRYDLGEYYLERDDYGMVRSILGELPKADERTVDLDRRTQYKEADAVLTAGNIEDGAQRFYRLGDFSDSASRYDDARTAIALRTYLSGDVDTARHLFIDIDDPGAHVAAGAQLIAGSDSEARDIAAREEFSTANLNTMKATYTALSEAREMSSGTRLAAGYRHTIGLRDDGHVLAAGDNSKGQCNVDGWSDIVQVAAGAAHTVGLRLDGTVLAVGDDSLDQCKVSGWTDIKAVAATAFGTLGLKSDGTVVATKTLEEKVSGWHGVTQIAGGSYSVGCLYGQGSMLCSHKGAQLNTTASLASLSVCGTVSAGLLDDGTMVSSYDGAPDWHDMAQVAVTQTGFVGVKKDGTALSYRFRDAAEQQMPIEGKAVEMAGSGTHVVILTEDGHAFAFGSNNANQCEVSDWRL